MTRTGLLGTVMVGWLLLGATCIPLIQSPPDTPAPATSLGVSIQSPSAETTLPQDAVLSITWVAFNTTGESATARLLVESRPGLTRTVIVEGIAVDGTVTTTTQWDTLDFDGGAYVIYAEITSAERTVSAAGPGRVTIDEAPTFQFTAPVADATLPDAEPLTIAWNGFDSEGNGRVTIALDPDSDHDNGDEILLHEDTLEQEATDGNIDWEGTDIAGETVEAGTYNLFALVNDDVNPETTVDAGVQITVSESTGGGERSLAITSPDEDTTFLRTDASLDIEYTIGGSDDVLIDLKIDTDDDHTNGNEATILSQQLVPGGTETDTFAWDGTYSDDALVPEGIYRIFIVLNSGASTPETAEGPGLVFRRVTADDPLIALLEPAGPQTVSAGSFVTLRWRDDDPTETATIHLTIDDDPRPAEGEAGSDEDMAEIEIVNGREAEPDGDLQDSYMWQVPGWLAPGSYYVFAYIGDSSSEPPTEQHSVAPGLLIIPDPANP